jgi:hypothetical protein
MPGARNERSTSSIAMRTHRALICVLGASIVLTGRGFEKSNAWQGAGTKRMTLLLAKIADETDAHPQDNPYWNEKRAEVLRHQIAQGKSTSEASLALAIELLFAGKTEEAITRFKALYDQMPVNSESRPVLQQWLGLADLRLGEQDNCIRDHNIESCLLPIKPGGYHALQRGSRMAVEQFTSILRENPDDLKSRWLLNIAYMTLGEYPGKVPADWLIHPEAFASEHEMPPFRDVAPQLGLDRAGLAGGAIIEDFDGDGYLDIMASSSGLRDQLRYYRNNADGTFTERTREAGLTGLTGGLNILQADYNNDGYSDVLVLRGGWMKKGGHHPMSLLRNNGNGTFEDVTEQAGLLRLHPTQTATWLDYDNDGWLDLYVGYESEPGDERACEMFHNNGDGAFTAVGASLGLANVGYVKAVVSGDFNNDGRPDLYLSRLGAANVLYRNDGPLNPVPVHSGVSPVRPWKFTDVSVAARVIEPRDSFPAFFFDYDNDGWLDIFVSGWRAANSVADVCADYLGLPFEGETPRLYHNNHDGTFSDVTAPAKLNRLLLTMGSNYGDIDNDGWPDIYLGTGAPDLAMVIPNRMFRNAGGKYFQDVTTATRTGHLQKGHGVAFGDIDNDGDQDIYETFGGAYIGDSYHNALFLNPGNRNHWITLRLEGVQSNRSAIGARIRVQLATNAGSRDVYATVGTGGTFGGNSLQQEIGLGDATAIQQIEIHWPTTNTTQAFRDVTMDRIVKVREGMSSSIPVQAKRIKLLSIDEKRPVHHHAEP